MDRHSNYLPNNFISGLVAFQYSENFPNYCKIGLKWCVSANFKPELDGEIMSPGFCRNGKLFLLKPPLQDAVVKKLFRVG